MARILKPLTLLFWLSVVFQSGCSSMQGQERVTASSPAATSRMTVEAPEATWRDALAQYFSTTNFASDVQDVMTASAYDWDFRRIPWLTFIWDY